MTNKIAIPFMFAVLIAALLGAIAWGVGQYTWNAEANWKAEQAYQYVEALKKAQIPEKGEAAWGWLALPVNPDAPKDKQVNRGILIDQVLQKAYAPAPSK